MKLLFKLAILLSSLTGLMSAAEKVCIDPGHQAKGNMQTEEIAPGSSKRKPKVAYGTKGVSSKKTEYQLNKAGCSVYLRLHADAGGSSARGATVLTSSAKNPHTRSVQKSSDRFSRAILSEYTKATGFKSRGVAYRDDLTGTNWSTVTNTLLEMGFMTNPEEDRKMASPDFQNVMVKGIVNGIDKYFREK